MGLAMATRLAKAGSDLTVYNRTRAKAEPLAQHGARNTDRLSDLADRDIVFAIVSTSDDLESVLVGPEGLNAGVPRHASLEFMNNSVLGSVFTRYKTPALVNLDFAVTFTPHLLRKDLDLGLDAGRELEVPLPLASLVRDMVQALIGHGHAD